LNEKYNKQNKQLHYLGLLLSNLTTNQAGRLAICNKNKNYFHRLISFISHPTSATRRRAAVQLIRNCCLDTTLHDWLLEDYDCQENYLIVKLLLPLCDGSDQMGEQENGNLDDEDILNLPVDLQYLDESHKREEDPETRQLLVESIWLLCSSLKGRKIMKSCNVYKLIRQLHMWESGTHPKTEKDSKFIGEGADSILAETELKLIELLIGDEPGEEMDSDHLLNLTIPENVKIQLETLDKVLEDEKNGVVDDGVNKITEIDVD